MIVFINRHDQYVQKKDGIKKGAGIQASGALFSFFFLQTNSY